MFNSPAPSFDDPLGLMGACHGRILDHCAALERLPAWLAKRGLDDQAKQAIKRVMHYFDSAGRHHHKDEEDDLFPLLRSDTTLTSLIDDLTRQHVLQETAWQKLANLLSDLLAGRKVPELENAINGFVNAYRPHIDLENTWLLPAAERLLSQNQIAKLGCSMAKRRGVNVKE